MGLRYLVFTWRGKGRLIRWFRLVSPRVLHLTFSVWSMKVLTMDVEYNSYFRSTKRWKCGAEKTTELMVALSESGYLPFERV